MAKKQPKTSRYRAIMKTFAERLRKAREAAGYKSAAALAGVLGIEEATYRKYERGNSEPTFDTLVRVCEVLDITPNHLFPMAKGKSSKKDDGGPDPRAVA
jgi:transcriptional regulator with XRE-family HTH domain